MTMRGCEEVCAPASPVLDVDGGAEHPHPTNVRTGAETSLANVFRSIGSLPAELWRLLRQVPPGRVTTYGGLAAALGDVRAARWVGEVLVDHPHDEHCPCHRVVRADGTIGLFIERDASRKLDLLQGEGVPVREGRVCLAESAVTAFDTDRPLCELRRLQEQLAEEVRLTPWTGPLSTVGAVDVSYVTETRAVAGYVRLRLPALEPEWSLCHSVQVTFPYIPAYLAFREWAAFGPLLQAVREAGGLPDVLLVDGHGVLHPRRAGSATWVGLLGGVTTVGIGKSLLCGSVHVRGMQPGEERPILHLGQVAGAAMTSAGSHRPIFVSPGQGIDLPGAMRVTRLVLGRWRVPVPIDLADRLSREEARRQRTAAQHPSSGEPDPRSVAEAR
jgi:deoxyribonuclease V